MAKTRDSQWHVNISPQEEWHQGGLNFPHSKEHIYSWTASHHPANPFLLDLKADYGALFSFFPSLPPQRHSAHLGSQVPPSPSWLSYWSADPHCPTTSICHVTPTVRWQAWPGQIAERNALSRDHKDRKMAFHHFVERPLRPKKPHTIKDLLKLRSHVANEVREDH